MCSLPFIRHFLRPRNDGGARLQNAEAHCGQFAAIPLTWQQVQLQGAIEIFTEPKLRGEIMLGAKEFSFTAWVRSVPQFLQGLVTAHTLLTTTQTVAIILKDVRLSLHTFVTMRTHQKLIVVAACHQEIA